MPTRTIVIGRVQEPEELAVDRAPGRVVQVVARAVRGTVEVRAVTLLAAF